MSNVDKNEMHNNDLQARYRRNMINDDSAINILTVTIYDSDNKTQSNVNITG